jgi:hypothetical protein
MESEQSFTPNASEAASAPEDYAPSSSSTSVMMAGPPIGNAASSPPVGSANILV